MPPVGGLQGKGILNLLGKPPLDPLTLVLRESAQNAWDARVDGGMPSMLIRYRILEEAEAQCLREFLMQGSTPSNEPAGKDRLAERLKRIGPIPVLEICDFGTEGLSGGVDPVRFTSRFTKFFFDIGNPHFDGSTGGTYGFGRASLYLAGAEHTIIADSLPADSRARRLMACRLGESYTAVHGAAAGKRHTGRHFWGVRGSGDVPVGPVEGQAAERLSKRLGMPQRDDKRRTGTTIMIPWPLVEPDDAAEVIPQILYHNLWPKLVPRADGTVPMKFEVEIDQRRESLDMSRAHDVYTSFAIALAAARSRSKAAKAIGPLRPDVVGGRVAVAPARDLDFPQTTEEGIDPFDVFRAGVCHVALMRSSELVVKYLAVESPATAPWVGVLLADSDPEVAAAFAGSEPPAHDDWSPKFLTGRAATIVRVTLRRLPEAVCELLGVKRTPTPAGTDIASLAAAADFFASEFIAGSGTNASPMDPPPRSGSGARPRLAMTPPEFVEFRVDPEQTIAVYRLGWSGGPGCRLEARADVAIDGGILDADEGIDLPRIVEWIGPDGAVSTGHSCATTGTGDYRVAVAYRGDYAVQLEVHQVEAA